MKLRVDLLTTEERRYQGPVSLKFAVTVGGITFGCLALIALVVVAHALLSVRSDLKAARANWQQIEGRYKAVTEKQKAEGDNQAILTELKLWGKQRIAWTDLLAELRRIAPATMQFTRLTVRSEWTFVKPPAKMTSDGKEIPQPAVPARRFFLGLEGRAAGDLADQVVVDFERAWRQSPGFQPLFESVKLQRLVREATGDTGRQPDRLFLIEGEFRARKLE